jgi:hypothetical protein
MSERTREPEPVERSQALLRAARTGDAETVAGCWEALAAWDAGRLATQLADDGARTAFWLNVYNAAVQDELRSDPNTYDSRLRFFAGNRVTVAGHRLSLNDIEHGILRRSRSVFLLGYGPRLLQSRFERTHRVSALDPRVHFALNCGAASCPPVAVYSGEDLDAELAAASRSYLTSEIEYDRDAGVVRVPRLFLWYHGDFGGQSGTLDLLHEYGALPADAAPTVRYRSYDWSLELDSFRDAERNGAGGGPASTERTDEPADPADG